MQTDDKPKRHGCLRALLWLGLVYLALQIAVSFLVRDYVLLMALFRLLIGWIAIVRVNVLQLSPSPAHLVTAVGVAIVALIGLHQLAVAWRKRVWPDLQWWRLRWSVAVFAGLLACSFAAIAVAGVAHQIAWLKGEHRVTSFRNQDRNRLSAFDLAAQLRDHADGEYPDALSEVRWQRGGMLALFPDRLLLYQASETATPEPWIYHGKGLNDTLPDGQLLLSAPRSVNGQRWVVVTPIEVMKVSEAEYHALVSQRRAKAQGGSSKTE